MVGVAGSATVPVNVDPRGARGRVAPALGEREVEGVDQRRLAAVERLGRLAGRAARGRRCPRRARCSWMNDSRTRQVSVAPVMVRAPAGRALTGGSPAPGVERRAAGGGRAEARARRWRRRRAAALPKLAGRRRRWRTTSAGAWTFRRRGDRLRRGGGQRARACACSWTPVALAFGATASVSSVAGGRRAARSRAGSSRARAAASRASRCACARSRSAPVVRSAFASPAASGERELRPAARRVAGRAHGHARGLAAPCSGAWRSTVTCSELGRRARPGAEGDQRGEREHDDGTRASSRPDRRS